jgi:competence ComEA-like helix-hairpin-helix protein
MSDAFKDYVARREAQIKSGPMGGGTNWLLILMGLLVAGVIVYLVLRGDPSTGPVNPNTADIEALITLPGVGPEMAEKIVELRATKPFTKVEDLLDVPGVGPKTLEKMKSRIKFE